MLTIVGLSGSLRRGSYNSALLRAIAARMPAGARLQAESISGIPLYNADDEATSGVPAAVARLKDAIAAADGLLLVTPEYNNGIPGVAKNTIDWLSRPPSDVPRVFRNRPVAIAGASPGGFGTVLAQTAWLPVFRSLGADLWSGGRLLVSHADKIVGPDGAVTDAATLQAIDRFTAGLINHIRGSRGAAGP
jgi:NAD(P)H-dependent FMN reductase